MSGPQVSYRESGYFHLTPKDEVTLTRIWISKDVTDAQSIALHTQYGEAIESTLKRNVILHCHV